MKIKFLKDRFGYKSNQEVEIEAVEASDFIAKGYAEEVKVDVLAEAMKTIDARIEAGIKSGVAEAVKKVGERLAARPTVVVGADNELSDPSLGYKSYAEFAKDVMAYSKGHTSKKMETVVKYTTGNTESGAAPDGSVAVPVEYSNRLIEICKTLPNIFDMTDKYPMQTNIVKIPVFANYDKSNVTPANGLCGNWINPDGGTQTQSRANFEQLSLTLNKLSVLVPVTDELLQDNNISLSQVLASQSAYQLTKDLNTALLKGAGSGSHQPLGVLAAGNAALIEVATATSAATGFTFADVQNIYASFAHDDANYANSTWIVHPTVIPVLTQMTSGNYNVYTAPGGADDLQVGRLMGRPLLVTGNASAKGTAGDISLVDFGKVTTGYKGGIDSAVSIHLFFDAQMTAFRFTLRVTGKPTLSKGITLEDGSTIVSPYVTLATRS